MTFRVVHYINQFYANIGGEEMAHVGPEKREGKVGPGTALAAAFGADAEIVGTVICGDNYFNEHNEEAKKELLEMVKSFNPDGMVAGPAFFAGRYGMACGDFCATVQDELGIPVVTGMFPENPGAESFSKKVFIVKTANSARGMKEATQSMAKLMVKLLKKEELGPAAAENYLPRGRRKVFFHEKNGAQRGLEMLLAKMKGEPFQTEYEMPTFNKIEPCAPVKDIKKATIALLTSGGIVPKGNPDKIRVSSAESYGRYDISELDDLTCENYESIHGGYDTQWANQNPDVVLPLDVLRQMEKDGEIGKIYQYVYCTTGTGTGVSWAEKFGQEIGPELKAAGVDAAILTSTWGSCTRCGASMSREIEKAAGIPVVQIATIVPIMMTVGSNRIVPGVAIPHPVGKPELGEEEDKKARLKLLRKALEAMVTPIDKQTIFKAL